MQNRSEAVAVARTWKGTPYILNGKIKGAGTDCGFLLACYLLEIGRISQAELDAFIPHSADWFLHASSEQYLRELMRFCARIAGTICRADALAKPGDLVLFRVVGSKLFNHGAIVTKWPMGVHAQAEGVREVNLVSHPLTSFHAMEIFDPWKVV